jgi:peptidoglycan/xylan/chitin deacetylase (PgdA/CDA1 family)
MNRCIVTTSWDDGQQFDEKLSSLLLDYGIKGTFYIAKSWKDRLVDTDLIRELDKNFEIGAHTLSHAILTNVSLERAAKETEGSKEWLEKLLDHKIEVFCYPSGKYNRNIVEVVKEAGFIGARALEFRVTLPENPFILGVGCQASNGSPLQRLKASLKSHGSLKSLIDWKTNAKMLFDCVMAHGGIFHLWGHSWEIEQNGDWTKLRDVLEYISNRRGVSYLENGQIIKLGYAKE